LPWKLPISEAGFPISASAALIASTRLSERDGRSAG